METRSKKELNKEFLQFYLESSLSTMRTGMVFTMALYLVLALVSILLFPEKTQLQYFLGFGWIIPILIISVLVMYIRPLKKHLHAIYIIINIFTALIIFIVGVTSDPSQKGYEYYYAWVMLLLIGLHVFYRLSFLSLFLVGTLQGLAYVVATLINGTYQINPSMFFNNLFFIFAMSSLGFFLTFLIQNLNRKNFLHQKALSENYKNLSSEIMERKLAEEALHRSERQYHVTLNSIPDWIYVVDEGFRFVMINASLNEVNKLNGFPDDINGKKMDEVYPFVDEKAVEETKFVFHTGIMSVTEQKLQLNGKLLFMETRRVPILKDDKVIQVMTLLRDRSKEREVEDLKLRNAEQKEVMLREIHHRVKNNLAIVISLLNLQKQKYPDPDLRRIMKDMELRIRSMALIHEHLYHSENLDQIPLADYLHDLSAIILGTFSGKKIKLITRLEAAEVNIETALPIGLITNELLTNAFKYAFTDQGEGIIQISLSKPDDDHIRLTISDNGSGLPSGFSLNEQTSLGMFIVRLLVEQLDGSIDVANDHGASFTIQFRNRHVFRDKILS